MYWIETYYDKNHQVQYCKCKNCNKYPAMSIYCNWDEMPGDEEGPFCELCWRKHIKKQFDILRKRLDDEDEGDMPPCKDKCVCSRDCHDEKRNREAELDRKFAEFIEDEGMLENKEYSPEFDKKYDEALAYSKLLIDKINQMEKDELLEKENVICI